MRNIFQKLLAFLRVRSTGAGLEVSDEVLRLTRFDGKVWQMDAIRLEPGVMERGKIKNRGALVLALGALKTKLGKGDKKKTMNVVVCLSSVQAYTQIFSLPVVQGEALDQAVALNLQMASPLEAGEAHSGWQVVGRNEATFQLEILSAFIERKVVDEMVDALFEAGFVVMAVESKALALTRMLREKGAGVDVAKPYLFVSIDNSGLDFLVIRNGSLYFEYTTLWRDLMDEKGEIAIPKFEEMLAANVRQVLNFYNQHWPEPMSAVILSATALAEQAERVLALHASLPAVRLTLVMGQPISSEWLVALGSSLRGIGLKVKDHEINLLGDDSRDRFHEEQLLHFMRFWRVIVPVALVLLVLTFVGADIFLRSTKAGIASRSNFQLSASQTEQIAALQTTAQTFNQSVALFEEAESTINPKNVVLGAILDAATASGVTISRISFQSFIDPINFSGSAPSQDRVVLFKTTITNDYHVSAMNLPLTGIQQNGTVVSFSMTFVYSP